MNDHYASIVHRDKAAQFQAEANGARQSKAARSQGAARPRVILGVSRRRLATLLAAILPTSGR